jgi:hypothetical protein
MRTRHHRVDSSSITDSPVGRFVQCSLALSRRLLRIFMDTVKLCTGYQQVIPNKV